MVHGAQLGLASHGCQAIRHTTALHTANATALTITITFAASTLALTFASYTVVVTFAASTVAVTFAASTLAITFAAYTSRTHVRAEHNASCTTALLLPIHLDRCL